MRFRVMHFRIMRFRSARAATRGGAVAGGDVPAIPSAPPLLPPLASGEWGIGHPTAESQRAGLEYLIQIAIEQAAARRCPPTWTVGTGRDLDWTSRAYPHS
jgi:hypothetical protein